MRRLFTKLVAAYGLNIALQQAIGNAILSRVDVKKSLHNTPNQAPKGMQFERIRETDTYTMRHTIEDGIERIAYLPKEKRFDTPIIMQHGMWHGAWCWENWQIQLAEIGWESHAHSLPGHAGSVKQRPLWRATLDYYLAFLKREIDRLPVKPILMGHSMGGALTQWYLKHVSDDLPAGVLVAPWVAFDSFADGAPLFFRLDPVGVILSTLTWNATPYVRSPYHAARKLISPGASLKPIELWAKLSGESTLVTMQHRPPYWEPLAQVNTPMLWLAAAKDKVVSLDGTKHSAAHYKADLHIVENAAHNLMMEHNHQQTAQHIHTWLEVTLSR